MKNKIWLIILVLLCNIPGQMVSAAAPGYSDYRYSTPQDFIRWVNDKTLARGENVHNRFVKVYKEMSDHILAPEVKGATLDSVCWGTRNEAINYTFFNENTRWVTFVYPLNAKYMKFDFNSLQDTVQGNGVPIKYNQIEQTTYTDNTTGETYIYSVRYEKKKLRLADNSMVDCIQKSEWEKREKKTLEQATFYFFKEDMLCVTASGYAVNNINYITQAMSKYSFQKYYTNTRLELNKKKNKVSRKNAILYATLQNPTKNHFTYVKLFIYDKKAKKYKFRYMKKMSKKDETKKVITVKLNVKQCIKKGVSQLMRMERRRVSHLKVSGKKYVRRKIKAMPLESKKKYRYKIQVKVGAKYYDAVGSFRLG